MSKIKNISGFPEWLPEEKCGGLHTQSLLSDEWLQILAWQWLSSQTAGQVTPKAFQDILNTVILPGLSITPKNPIGLHTSHHWLFKLGWHHRALKKGIYMDGHEHNDVDEYCKNIFLPLMEKYQKRMAKWVQDDEANFMRIPPTLQDSEKEIIPNFQDESCFHANEYKSSAWYHLL